MALNQYIKWGYIISSLIYALVIALIIWVFPWHRWVSWGCIIIFTLLFIFSIIILIITSVIIDSLPEITLRVKQGYNYIVKIVIVYLEEMFRFMIFPSSTNVVLSERIQRRIDEL